MTTADEDIKKIIVAELAHDAQIDAIIFFFPKDIYSWL